MLNKIAAMIKKEPQIEFNITQLPFTSNIKNKIKLENRAKIQTGLANFDTLIEGGFKKNSTNLIMGGQCH